MKKIKTLIGWMRLNVFRQCPLCNHDAPDLYECPVCEYYKKWPRYISEQTKEQKILTWKKFKEVVG